MYQSVCFPVTNPISRSYFGQEGIDYSMGRVPIGGTDFSTRPYTYDDDVQDLGGVDANLTKFALQPEDFKLKVNIYSFPFSIYNFPLLQHTYHI